MPLITSTVQSLRRVFRQAFVVQDIAEPLVSFDASHPASELRAFMKKGKFDVVGVRTRGRVTGFVRLADLGDGPCGDVAREIDEALVVPGTASLADLLRFEDERRLFVSILGAVDGIVSRSDLQKPPARMWLFGMVTLIEMRLSRLIEERAPKVWKDCLSEGRVQKAKALRQERKRLGRDVDLLSCLQLSDKVQILAKTPELRAMTRFDSRRQLQQNGRMLERLRNNLAHSQDIVTDDWNTIVTLSERLDSVLEGPPGLDPDSR